MKQSKDIKRKELHKYMKMNHMQKSEFASMVGVSPATISKWLYTDTVPSLEVLRRISRRLGLDIDEVYEWFPEADEGSV